MADKTGRQRTLADTQTAGFGLAKGRVAELLVAEFDDDRPAITVRHDRVDHPDSMEDRDVRTTTVDAVTVTPTDEIDRQKIEIGTNHGRDRVIVETNDDAPRAYVRHERKDSGWNELVAWELHPVTGISQVGGETVSDGGTATSDTDRIAAIGEVAVRWGVTVNEADAFLESVGFVEEAHKWCPACFRRLDDTDGEPVSGYGKTYCRGCAVALFDNVRERKPRSPDTGAQQGEDS